MENTPADCFRLEELEQLQSFEGRALDDVNYYLWMNDPADGTPPYRFLYAIELLFDNQEALLISADEDSTALLVVDAETLVNTVQELNRFHGRISLQRIGASAFPVWQEVVGEVLQAVRLSPNEQGLYWNDAILFDFEKQPVIVGLNEKEGLAVQLHS